MKAAFCTRGCKVNQYDTEAMRELFENAGYEIVDFSEPADIYVVNTCTVTQTGDKKSRQMISRAHALAPEAKIIVAGCYSQRAPEEVLALPGVSLVIGTKERANVVGLAEALQQGKKHAVSDICREHTFEPLTVSHEGRTRAHLKIQEGCDRFCTYCIIPYARGPIRSRPLLDVRTELEKLAAAGYREVVLTGIHLMSYGRDLPEAPTLLDAIAQAEGIAGIRRIRLGSLEPQLLSDAFVHALSENPKICRQFHLSLQSGSAGVLARMKRRYTPQQYFDCVRSLRAAMPECAITTDIIVGFPGETAAEFEETLAFARTVSLARIHVFPYSRREGTKAAEMPGQLSRAVKAERAARLGALAAELSWEYASRFVGTEQEVLFEERDKECLAGHTGTYLRVTVPSADDALLNRFARVRIVRAEKGELRGELISVESRDQAFNIDSKEGGKPMEPCLFCKIASGEIPSAKVYEDDEILAFRDIAPAAPEHVLIIPKKHYDSVMQLDDDALLARMFAAAREIAKTCGISESGFRLIINTGKDGGQTVGHLHMHMLGARELGWPPG